MVARTQNLVFAWTVGIVQGDAHDGTTSLGTHNIRIIGQIDSIVRPVVDAAGYDIGRTFSWGML